jgi:hypothetical protein
MSAMQGLKCYIVLAVFSLSGCAPVVYQTTSEGASQAEVELVPPVPTFISLGDCERAYGLSSCGTGQVIYTQSNLPPPPDSANWYMPFAFGVMTGVLVNQFYSPPTVYVGGYRYRQYLSPTYVSYYRRINTVQVTHYRNAPLAVQRSTFTSSRPVRYVPPTSLRSPPVQAPRAASAPATRPVYGTAPDSRPAPKVAPKPAPIVQPASVSTPAPQRSPGTAPAPKRSTKEKNEK